MMLSKRINKKFLAGLSIIFFIFAIMLMHKSYAGKQTISLNAAVSFPIDI